MAITPFIPNGETRSPYTGHYGYCESYVTIDESDCDCWDDPRDLVDPEIPSAI